LPSFNPEDNVPSLAINPKLLREKYGISIFDFSLSQVNRQKILLEISSDHLHSTRSHWIYGRWENVYINSYLTPSVERLLNRAVSFAGDEYGQSFLIPSQFLGYPTNEYWFNIAQPGESTGRHNHKDEAAISGLFYIKVPEDSGELIFFIPGKNKITIPVKEGRMLLFPADLDHAVDLNRSEDARISLAFNCYSSELPPQLYHQDETYGVHKYFS
tara:strand:+ start:223 stop:867 length:645 start_codon:yes stop_codon:yes gene_type:complete